MNSEIVKLLAEKIPKGYNPVAQLSLRTKDINRAIANSYSIKDKNDVPALYVYNYSDGGFAIISADHRHEPILTVQDEGSLAVNAQIPGGMNQWLLTTVQNIELLRANLHDNTARAHELRWDFINDVGATSAVISGGIISSIGTPCIGCPSPSPGCLQSAYNYGPFLTTTWGQRCTYNNLCPDLACVDLCLAPPRALTGCVATAMAQVIRYWSAPALTKTICIPSPLTPTTYNYASMPDNSGNNEVQRLMRDAGTNVCKDYGCTSSGAQSSDAGFAIKNFYGFGNATYEVYSGFSAQVSPDLTQGHPVIMDGCEIRKEHWFYTSYERYHMWVVDGMRGDWTTDCSYVGQYHMNWSWDGQVNGWYTFNDWLTTNNFNFQYARNVIRNIEPTI